MISSLQILETSPLFESIRPGIRKFKEASTLPSLAELNRQLDIAGIKFVPQESKSSEFENGYEPRIYLKGQVQTREKNWHDFFNALVWHQFPRSKKIINQMHYHEQERRYPETKRSSIENMLALFDENGVIIIAKNLEWLQMIKEHRWKELFWDHRQDFSQQVDVHIFGHGLYEKCLAPFIGITGKALLFQEKNHCDIDILLEQFLAENTQQLAPDLLSPLPILGIPGWWPENEQPSFYDNKTYFRDKN